MNTRSRRVKVNGVWHIPLNHMSTLRDLEESSGKRIQMPDGFGWATLQVGSVRLCALVAS